jgi:hypothetical protein
VEGCHRCISFRIVEAIAALAFLAAVIQVAIPSVSIRAPPWLRFLLGFRRECVCSSHDSRMRKLAAGALPDRALPRAAVTVKNAGNLLRTCVNASARLVILRSRL